MGNRSEPSGPDETPERSLFKVLEAKNANRSGSSEFRGAAIRRSSGRNALWLCVVAAIIATAFVVIPFASSANPDISGFELDGNVAHNAATTPPDDWATIFDASGNPTGAGSALATDFVTDGTGASDTGFAGGGSKDDLDISKWGWSTGVTPAKDDIARAYAAVYAEQGQEILYFAQERVDTQAGDANMGFWFIQDPTVGPIAGGNWAGKHTDGDILVQSSLTNGGGVSDIHVFKWDSSANDPLVEITGLDAGACAGGKLGTKTACAFANTGPITRPWGVPLASPYFYEGGLNLSAIFPNKPLPCFSTFISNTRTSQSTDAVLKDYANGSIDTCGSIVIKKVTLPSGVAQKFDFTSDVAGNATFQLADGESRTMSKLIPGTYHVSEGATAAGWSFDSVSCGVGASYVQKSGANLTIALPLVGKVECTYVNKRDSGSLTLSKVLTGGPAGYTGPFTINYDCSDGTAHDGSKSVSAGSTSSAITGIPTGTQCTISETPPTAPTGYTFGAPSFSPSATVTITTKDQTVNVQTTNTLTSTTPPVTPPSPKADITVTKAATPAVQLPIGGGSMPITYSIVVSNAGPDAAQNVKVADAAPASVTFVSATTSAGTCTTTALALDCTISSIPAGGSVSITINATVSSTGTKVNVVTTTTTTPETNPNNNTAQAQTVVTATAVPPTPKPKPKPKPAPTICSTVTVTQKVLTANGKPQTISVKVTQGKRGVSHATVKITGPGISKTMKTDKNGRLSVSVKAKTPGIIRVEIVGKNACNTQRVGVVGAYEPPVTG